jgi:IrrE N-terminal-like domain
MSALHPVVQQETSVPTQLTPMQILAKYHSEAPVDILGLARELGINVWGMDLLPNISGKIFRDAKNGGSSGFSIAVNRSEAPVRQRFTIAHEIAHFLLHRHLLESKGSLIDDTMYRSGLSSAEEVAANKMAAHILMPFSLINALVNSGVNDVASLAARLQVSKTAMAIRLGIPT